MINAERQSIPIIDIHKQLRGIVSEGLMNRVAQLNGAIPDSGPGRYCIPRALQTQVEREREQAEREKTKAQGTRFPQTKIERRLWNLNHR